MHCEGGKHQNDLHPLRQCGGSSVVCGGLLRRDLGIRPPNQEAQPSQQLSVAWRATELGRVNYEVRDVHLLDRDCRMVEAGDSWPPI